MKIEKLHKTNLFDVDYNFKLRIESVARLFQEMATSHSTQIGAGPGELFKKGVVWFLNRLEIEMFYYPMLDENLKITTWSRGIKSYKSYRDYSIQSSKGQVARGSSVWLFFDQKRKRISKVPNQIASLYEVDNEKCFDKEIDDWKSCGKIDMEKELPISLRYSDFDVNGHVNNTRYIEFLETLYHKTINTGDQPIRNIKIRFCREISKDKESILSGWHKVNGIYQCNIFDDSTLYADAQITPIS
jgi:medium-chain acyl-[acyl-carrier-protein] hydrolase